MLLTQIKWLAERLVYVLPKTEKSLLPLMVKNVSWMQARCLSWMVRINRSVSLV
ncbi:hypothetical protein D3C78_1713200 [compost metagenome]